MAELTSFSFTTKKFHDDAADSLAMLADYLSERPKIITVAKRQFTVLDNIDTHMSRSIMNLDRQVMFVSYGRIKIDSDKNRTTIERKITIKEVRPAGHS